MKLHVRVEGLKLVRVIVALHVPVVGVAVTGTAAVLLGTVGLFSALDELGGGRGVPTMRGVVGAVGVVGLLTGFVGSAARVLSSGDGVAVVGSEVTPPAEIGVNAAEGLARSCKRMAPTTTAPTRNRPITRTQTKPPPPDF